MVIRKVFAVALATALAVGGAGCPKPEHHDNPPPPEHGAGGTDQPGGAPVTEPGGEKPGGGDMSGGQPPGGGDTTKPAGAGAGDGAATAADTVKVVLGLAEATVHVPGAAAEQHVGLKENEVSQDLVNALKQAHDTLVAAGQHPKVVFTGPLEVPETVVYPSIKAAIRAGFAKAEVEYKPDIK